jgi:hypothetical protein
MLATGHLNFLYFLIFIRMHLIATINVQTNLPTLGSKIDLFCDIVCIFLLLCTGLALLERTGLISIQVILWRNRACTQSVLCFNFNIDK